jgi:Rad3-related DNA helicase
VRLIPIGAIARHAEDIDQVLAGLQDKNASYRFKMLRANLSSCLFYVSRSEFYIRPMIPPTFEHKPFTDPTQRIYLSATLGDAGELERAFGRTDIKRVPVPTAWDRTGSGRRFFVFPELAALPTEPSTAADDTADQDDNDADEKVPAAGLVGDLLNLATKRLVLTPDDDSATKIAKALGVPANQQFTAKDADTGIQPFIDADTGTLLAPNRYDGMDLADNACRMMLMAGLPTASHLQDRFLETKLRASAVLQERIRTRVLQGAGRCTRGPKDWAVVVVTGEDILRFLSRAEVAKSLPVELQAEITFGFEQSQAPADDLLYLAESALTQDEIWQEDAEPELAKLRREATRVPQPNVSELATSTVREVRAWTYAWQ